VVGFSDDVAALELQGNKPLQRDGGQTRTDYSTMEREDCLVRTYGVTSPGYTLPEPAGSGDSSDEYAKNISSRHDAWANSADQHVTGETSYQNLLG
jgi:hypothetical protein